MEIRHLLVEEITIKHSSSTPSLGKKGWDVVLLFPVPTSFSILSDLILFLLVLPILSRPIIFGNVFFYIFSSEQNSRPLC